MEKQGKLELTWVGKYEEERLEPRILIEDPEKSNGEDSENMLIHGDNLLALRALENDFSGKIKCVYIDPPYNTGSAFEYYDDDLEHSIWLGLMRERLLILRNLLRDDGFLCCHIDDSEGAYLKVLLDEVFGRQNYLTTIYVRVRYPEKTLKQDMSFHKEIEYIHVYRKSSSAQPISKEVNWVGGGGYKFYELAEPLLVKNPILPIYQINPSYTWDMVCEAICKIEGFTYDPSGEFQGYSSENRFIHITEEFVNSKYVMSVMKNLGDNRAWSASSIWRDNTCRRNRYSGYCCPRSLSRNY